MKLLNIKCPLILFGILLLGHLAAAANLPPLPIVVPTGAPGQTISLDGTWLFQPVMGELAAESHDAAGLDALAQSLDQTPGTNWFPLAMPQFLNRYSWWLDISKKFVAADNARLAALPFYVKKVQAGWYLRQWFCRPALRRCRKWWLILREWPCFRASIAMAIWSGSIRECLARWSAG